MWVGPAYASDMPLMGRPTFLPYQLDSNTIHSERLCSSSTNVSETLKYFVPTISFNGQVG